MVVLGPRLILDISERNCIRIRFTLDLTAGKHLGCHVCHVCHTYPLASWSEAGPSSCQLKSVAVQILLLTSFSSSSSTSPDLLTGF